MTYRDRIFERHDVYDVLLYRSEDLYYGDRELSGEHIILDVETAESDTDLGGIFDMKKMNSVVYGILKKEASGENIIVQVVRKVKPGDSYADTIYADRVVHELNLIKDNSLLAYNASFDKGITKNLLKQASDKGKAEYLLKCLNFKDIKFGHISKNEAMRKFNIQVPISFSDGSLCPDFFKLWIKTKNESFLELVCNRNLSCLDSENEIAKKLVEIGYLKL